MSIKTEVMKNALGEVSEEVWHKLQSVVDAAYYRGWVVGYQVGKDSMKEVYGELMNKSLGEILSIVENE